MLKRLLCPTSGDLIKMFHPNLQKSLWSFFEAVRGRDLRFFRISARWIGWYGSLHYKLEGLVWNPFKIWISKWPSIHRVNAGHVIGEENRFTEWRKDLLYLVKTLIRNRPQVFLIFVQILQNWIILSFNSNM